MRDRGAVLDCQLVRDAHVSAVVKSCNFHLYQLSRVRHFITDEACKLAVHALVVSRLDFCNRLLVGTSEKNLEKLQKLQHWAAHLVCQASRGTGAGHACMYHLFYGSCIDCPSGSGSNLRFVFLYVTACMGCSSLPDGTVTPSDAGAQTPSTYRTRACDLPAQKESRWRGFQHCWSRGMEQCACEATDRSPSLATFKRGLKT